MALKWLKRLIYDRSYRLLVLLSALGVVALFSFVSPWFQASIAGRAEIVDGDSLRIGRHRVRLMGIDAPEKRQTCMRERRSWACGRAARDTLRRLVGGQVVNCRVSKQDRYGRALAHCIAGSVSLNQRMVSEGMAVAFGEVYRREEWSARARRRGLWASEFVRPQIWRRDNLRN